MTQAEDRNEPGAPQGGIEAPRPPALPVSPQEYAEFVRQLELTDIWLARASVENHYGPGAAAQARLQVSSHDTFELQPDGFDAYVEYRVAVMDENTTETLGVILVEFGTHFLSEQRLSPDLFEVFRRTNLPVNTWPYLREFLQSTASRMNWQAVTLPVYKVNVAGEPRGPRRRPAEEAAPTEQPAAAEATAAPDADKPLDGLKRTRARAGTRRKRAEEPLS